MTSSAKAGYSLAYLGTPALPLLNL